MNNISPALDIVTFFDYIISRCKPQSIALLPQLNRIKMGAAVKISISFTLLAYCLIACPAFAQTHVPPGPVSGHWTFTGSPYLIEGEIIISPSTSLLIDPGVEVIFQRHYKFIIQGILTAVGIETDSITFTAADTSRGWHGLRFYYLNTQLDSSRLVYCKITCGISSSDNNTWEDKHGGAIFCINSDKLVIQNCLISNNRTADIYGSAGANGTSGPEINGEPGENVTTGHGGAVFLHYSNPIIRYNIFYNNLTGFGYGGNGGIGGDEILPGEDASFGGDGGQGGIGQSGNGGAIYCLFLNPMISYNCFNYNFTGDGTGGHGGEGGEGFASSYYSSPGGFGGDGGSGGSGISGKGGAIYLESSNALISNNIFDNNFTGSCLGGHGGDAGDGEGYGTMGATGVGGYGGRGGDGIAGIGGSICLCTSNPLIRNNLMIQNLTGSSIGGNGGDGGEGTANNTTAAAGYGGDGGDGGDGQGGDGCFIYAIASNPSFSNNTITQHRCGLGCPGSGGEAGPGSHFPGQSGNYGSGVNGTGVLYIDPISYATISNSIIWNNIGVLIIGNPPVSWSCIEGGYFGIGNIGAFPEFVDPENGDYHLQSIEGSYHGGLWLPDSCHSPCIDAGNPDSLYENEPEPNGGRINMGAYGNTEEASLSVISAVVLEENKIPNVFKLYPNYPNPFNPQTTIRFGLPAASMVSLKIYDISGRLVATISDRWFAAGYHQTSFDASGLASGIYLACIQAGDFTQTQKMVLIK